MKTNTAKKTVIFISVVFSVIYFSGCGNKPIPRPYGYFRVDLPTNEYIRFDSATFPYSFDKPNIAKIVPHTEKGENYWIDISYPSLNANIYCTYKPIHNDLFSLVEDSRKIVYKHVVRADAISETPFENSEKKVYGILYELEGNSASNVQFIVTDSVKHFFRGALYFDNVPNKDSIAPMANFIHKDIVRLMESFQWKN